MLPSSQHHLANDDIRTQGASGQHDETAHPCVGKHSHSRRSSAIGGPENATFDFKRNSVGNYSHCYEPVFDLHSQVPLPTVASHEASAHIGDTISGDRGSAAMRTSNGDVITRKVGTSSKSPPADNPIDDEKVALVGKNKRLTEQERIAERNRKGRERSMRTRRRNASRLKTLQENCAYLHKENGVLRQILISVRDNLEWPTIRSLLGRLAAFRADRPPLYLFASKEAEAAARQGRRPNSFITLALQGAQSQALHPDSVTATNLIESARVNPKDTGDKDDTMSTNGHANTINARQPQPAEREASDLFGWLTDASIPAKVEHVKESVKNLDAVPRLTYEELAILVGNTEQ